MNYTPKPSTTSGHTQAIGDSWNNALAPNVNGDYKNELVHTRTWRDVLEVEIGTFDWANWWKQARLHQVLDCSTPVEVENDYWRIASTAEKIVISANAQEATPGHFTDEVSQIKQVSRKQNPEYRRKPILRLIWKCAHRRLSKPEVRGHDRLVAS